MRAQRPLPIVALLCLCLCLSAAYIGPKSRTERPRKTKIGTEVAHVTCDSDTTFKVKRSKVNMRGRGHIVAASCTVCYSIDDCFCVAIGRGDHRDSARVYFITFYDSLQKLYDVRQKFTTTFSVFPPCKVSLTAFTTFTGMSLTDCSRQTDPNYRTPSPCGALGRWSHCKLSKVYVSRTVKSSAVDTGVLDTFFIAHDDAASSSGSVALTYILP